MFFLFQRYPFLLDLDLIGIANHFAQFNLSAFALGTLLLIPCASKKDQQIKVHLIMLGHKRNGHLWKKSLFPCLSFSC